VGVSLRRQTVPKLWCLALAGAFSCSVFPDEATLPGGAAGKPGSAGASVGGSSVLPAVGGTATTGGVATLPEGGANESGPPGGEGGMPPLGEGGAMIAPGGAAGMPTCADPQESVLLVSADTWIEAAKPSAGHGSDKELSIVGGGQERRALLEVALPAAPTGAVLLKATLALHLQGNADVGLAERRLQVRVLEQPVSEARSTWNNWGNGASRKWLTPGGDFGSVVAATRVPAGTAEGSLTFNVTGAVRQAFAPAAGVLSFIVLENGAPPAAPAELAFTSSEGDASGAPALILEYCEP